MKTFILMVAILWAVVTSELLVSHDIAGQRLSARVDSLAAVLDSVTHLPPPPRNLRAERDSIVVEAAREVGVPATTALGVAWVENPRADSMAVSRAGAVGLMQVMPPEALAARGDTAGALARAAYIIDICGLSHSLYERECNTRVGLHLYRDFLDRFGKEWTALAAYNGALKYPVAARRYVSKVRTYAQALEVVGAAR